jgi:hypothetical protein
MTTASDGRSPDFTVCINEATATEAAGWILQHFARMTEWMLLLYTLQNITKAHQQFLCILDHFLITNLFFAIKAFRYFQHFKPKLKLHFLLAFCKLFLYYCDINIQNMAHIVNILRLPKVYGANTAERRHAGVKSVGQIGMAAMNASIPFYL